MPSQRAVDLKRFSLPGFGIRLTPSCKTFIVEGMLRGTRRRWSIGRYPTINLDDARREAQHLLSNGIAGAAPKPKVIPNLAQLLDAYFASRHIMKPVTKKTYRSLVERLFSDWLGLPISAISKEMVMQRHEDLIRPTRCGTDNKACANRAMHVLRALFNFAGHHYEQDGHSMINSNPTDAMRWRWYKIEARQGVIPDKKLPEFYRAVMTQPSKIARDFILVLLFTWLRRNEASKLKWADINFEASTLTIPASSNKSSRTIFELFPGCLGSLTLAPGLEHQQSSKGLSSISKLLTLISNACEADFLKALLGRIYR